MSTQTNSDMKVSEVMLGLDSFPVMPGSTILKEALEEMGRWRLGIVCVVDDQGRLTGIFTDGDIRRKLLTVQKPFSALFVDDVQDHATDNPTTINPDSSVLEAVNIMGDKQVWDLPVVDGNGKLVGLLHLHPVVKALMD